MDSLDDILKPVYEFEFPDGTVRRSDDIEDPEGILQKDGIEFLRELVEYHEPEADVNLLKYVRYDE